MTTDYTCCVIFHCQMANEKQECDGMNLKLDETKRSSSHQQSTI